MIGVQEGRQAAHPLKGGGSLPWRGAFLGLVVSGLFMAVFLYGLHWEEIKALPSQINLFQVAMAAMILFLEFPLRVLRWALLLRPMKKDKALTTFSLTRITFIGFMANNVLPARAGELIRPWMASRRGKLPFESVLVTCALERSFDLIGLGSVALLMAVLLPSAGAHAMDSALLTTLTDYAAILGGLSALGLFLLVLMVLKGEMLRPLVTAILRYLPGPLGAFAKRIFEGIAQGLTALGSGSSFGGAIFISVAIWLNGAVAIWVLMGAFGIELPLAAACFLQVTIALAVVLPQAPGFIGVFQVATEKTLLAWGVGIGVAQGFALGFWLVSFVPVTFFGLMALWLEGVSLKGLVHESRGMLSQGLKGPLEEEGVAQGETIAQGEPRTSPMNETI